MSFLEKSSQKPFYMKKLAKTFLYEKAQPKLRQPPFQYDHVTM